MFQANVSTAIKSLTGSGDIRKNSVQSLEIFVARCLGFDMLALGMLDELKEKSKFVMDREHLLKLLSRPNSQ